MAYLTKQLEKDIVKGGLILAPCRAGKTTAIVNVLKKDESFILVVDTYRQKSDYVDRLGAPKEQVQVCRVLRAEDSPYARHKIVLDEALFSPYSFSHFGGKCHAMLSSPNRVPVVCYNIRGDRVVLEPAEDFRG